MNIKWKIILLCTIFIGATTNFWYFNYHKKSQGIIKVGILHSLTGAMAISEKSIVNAALMAIDEINESGGVLGKKLVPIVADGASDWPTFASQAERLITQEQVAVIFGCWTSASRKMVKPVVEKHNSLLFYPAHHEGLEQSPNIVYTGATANQQAIPAVTWCLQNFGNRIFLVGSNSIFSKAINEIISDLVYARNGVITGEEYIDSANPNAIELVIQKIIATQSHAIINTTNVETNQLFFSALRRNGISSEKIPTMSLSITEVELAQFDIDNMIGDYVAQSYFQSLNTQKNKQFVKKFKKKYNDVIISDTMINTYIGVYFWKNAVIRAQSTNTDLVRKNISEESINAPSGVVSIDKETQHVWKIVLIGKVFTNKQFGIIWSSINTIEPIPYLLFKTKEEWEALLDSWYQQWGGTW